jgi:hypothetical protein
MTLLDLLGETLRFSAVLDRALGHPLSDLDDILI